MIAFRTLFLAALTAVSLSAPPAHAGKYDGNWSMVAETTRGHCGIISVGMGINRGRIYSTGGWFAFNPIKLSGQVAASGGTRITAITGPRVARGTGRFSFTRGKGTWSGTGPSGLCSGVWTATRS